MTPTANQFKLAARIEAAYQAGGAEACTARRLYTYPQGRDYRRLDALVEVGLVEKVPVQVGNRAAQAWIPKGASKKLSMSEMVMLDMLENT